MKKNKVIKSTIIAFAMLLFMCGCSYSDLIPNDNVGENSDSSVNENENGNNSTNNQKAIDVSIGQNVTYDDNYIISFVDYLFTQRLNPSNPDSYYTYYEAKDKSANTLFILKTTVKNLGAETLDGDSLPKGTLIYDSKYKYDLSTITEADDGSDLEGYSWYMDIDPLKSKKIWYKVEVPMEIESNTDKSLAVEYVINNKTYHVNLR